MKLLTINTHSLAEKDCKIKQEIFVDAVLDIKPDIIAMQEVNQSRLSKTVDENGKFGIKSDNYALDLYNKFKERGMHYHYVWEGIKHSYGKFDEGIAVFSNKPIETSHSFYISADKDINNWKTRMALGIFSRGNWYYSIHLGRYDDREEPFLKQWQTFCDKRKHGGICYVMGDFNCPDTCEEYKRITEKGWYDTFDMAMRRDEGYSVCGTIDGWENRKDARMRIDYILADKPVKIRKSEIVFNGENYGIVSDHFGVLVTV